MLKVDPRNAEAYLNHLYKNLSPKTTYKLENFNGRRHISVFRGKNFMNKTTQKLDPDHPLMLIRRMVNIGTKSEPQLKTAEVQLRSSDTDIFVYIDKYKYGPQYDGMHLEIIEKKGLIEPYQKRFDNFEQIRQDNFFREILEGMTGKKLFRPKKPNE